MKKQIEQVREFFTAFKIPIQQKPCLPSLATQDLRVRLIQEEVDEFNLAMTNEDLVEAVDAIIDQAYVVLGHAVALGVADKFELLFNEVHKSNMTKLDDKGKPVYKPCGKVGKSKNFVEPDLKAILESDKTDHTLITHDSLLEYGFKQMHSFATHYKYSITDEISLIYSNGVMYLSIKLSAHPINIKYTHEIEGVIKLFKGE